LSFNDRFESLNVTTVGSTKAGSPHADGPAGTLGAVWFVAEAASWLPPGPPADGALEVGSSVEDSGAGTVGFAAGVVVFFAWLGPDCLAGFGQTFTRTHFRPRFRRTNLHFGFGFAFAFR
jgi:hypothetical protein